ncbi:uncharacterized protein LOC116264058 isoform X5 [Nymphaea colorata]|uniref:uncharacterized protein LOC116264058 isoform X5 n=1 Tax=Nymphaea colorata TaxID=210225 RepID=UPI00129EB620|nr:uncharacterized protein LOC116264058 isoform X5 [Nymphaea colorata]
MPLTCFFRKGSLTRSRLLIQRPNQGGRAETPNNKKRQNNSRRQLLLPRVRAYLPSHRRCSHRHLFAVAASLIRRFTNATVAAQNGGKPPLTYQSFLKLAGSPQLSIALLPQKLPSLGDFGECDLTSVPRINELGYGNLRQV